MLSSLNAITNGAVGAMEASQLGVAISSNNISNAQNTDYTRQRLVTVPAAMYDAFPSIGR